MQPGIARPHLRLLQIPRLSHTYVASIKHRLNVYKDCVPLNTGVQNPVDWVHLTFFAVQTLKPYGIWQMCDLGGHPQLWDVEHPMTPESVPDSFTAKSSPVSSPKQLWSPY